MTFDGRQFVYGYDSHTQLTAKTEIGREGGELTTRYAYDAQGKLIEKTLPDESTISYHYDLLGNLTGVDDGQWPLAYDYDVMGRLTVEHQGWASAGYRYDAMGHLTAHLLPDGQQIDYQFQHGRLQQVSLNGHCLTQHQYQVSGLETRRTQGALTSHFQYDELGRLSEHRVSQAQQQTLFRRYQYNRSGNLTQVEDNLRGVTQYHYDPLDRLTQVRGNISESFAHDPAGNLIQDRLSNVSGNQLLFQGDCHYQYDEFGNLIQEARGTQQSLITTYAYDCQHRLIKVAKPDGSSAEYRYDAFGRRIHKAVTDKTGQTRQTEFLWQGDKLLAESGEHHYQTYLYEYGSFKPLALVTGEGADNATPYFYHLDQIGTPLEITDATGAVAWSVDYHSYGNVAYQRKAEIVSPLRFQGQYYDAETGLHYNRHRYYSPSTGRFITPDPIGLAGGLNNYQYVKNPTGWIDPLGLTQCVGDCPGAGSSTQSAKDRVLANIAESQAARNASNMGNGLNYDSLPISNKNATRLLENRALGRLSPEKAHADALGVVQSFDGQIYMRRGKAGEMFESFSDINSETPASLVFVTQGLRDTTSSLDRQIILALPDSKEVRNSAIRYRPAILKVDQILLEGKVAGQQGGLFGSKYKAGGGHQTVTDGGRFSGKVGFGDE